MLSIIVAKAKNNIIGKENKLIWHIPDDLKRFKELTTGHNIIMGRKTFESLGGILPNRKHIVFTQNPEENFVIGGAMIYNLLMPYVTKMYVTEIDKDFDGDTFFPKINTEIWKEVSREKGPSDDKNDFDYDYVTYERVK